VKVVKTEKPARSGIKFGWLVGAAVLGLGLFTLNSAVYTLHESEQAVVVQLGDPVKEVTTAGLHLHVPFVQEVRRFDKRIFAWDGDPNEIPTAGGEFIWVDTTARWRIVAPQRFMESVRDEASARSRLSDVIDSVVRDQIAGTELVEIVRSSDWGHGPANVAPHAAPAPTPAPAADPAAPTADGAADPAADGAAPADPAADALQRDEVAALTQKVKTGRQALTRTILEKSREVVAEYGIEIVDVQIKRINYLDSVQEQVFRRMISDQERRAEEFRSEGQGESARILGEARRELATIRSNAEREAQVIRGEADAEATRIYNEAYGADAEFYAFLRTLQSYEKTVDGKTTLMLGTDSEYYRFLQGTSGR
jgi:membrane protease subunit HflC